MERLDPMGREIERKFLPADDRWRGEAVAAKRLRQAYLAQNGRLVTRVRTVDGKRGFLTLKSVEPGISRAEYEYEIPVADAEELMDLRQGLVIEKTRHIVPAGEVSWEVDEFGGAHAGLVIAEIELPSVDAAFARPDWLGREVTGERAYTNAALAQADG